jgi:malonyl CoA-acyl carrier protein transacylase
MEKGMKAQLKVGKGDGDLPSIPGVTAYVVADDYKATLPELMAKAETEAVSVPAVVATAIPAPAATVQQEDSVISGVTVIGLALGLLAAPFLARKFKGMSVSEVVAYVFDLLRSFIELVVKLLSRLINLIGSNKNKILPEK